MDPAGARACSTLKRNRALPCGSTKRARYLRSLHCSCLNTGQPNALRASAWSERLDQWTQRPSPRDGFPRPRRGVGIWESGLTAAGPAGESRTSPRSTSRRLNVQPAPRCLHARAAGTARRRVRTRAGVLKSDQNQGHGNDEIDIQARYTQDRGPIWSRPLARDRLPTQLESAAKNTGCTENRERRRMKSVTRRAVILLATLAGGCTVHDPLYCDESHPCTSDERPYCDVAGEFPASEGIGRTCIPTPSDGGISGSPSDAASDSGSREDASQVSFDAGTVQASFDVGYVSQWRIGTDGTNLNDSSWIRIVNTGVVPLDLSTGRITNVVEDISEFNTTVTWETPTVLLEPARSAGGLSPDAFELIVGDGIVTEPAQDTSQIISVVRISNFPPPGNWLILHVEVTFQVENASATLPLVLVASGTGTTVDVFEAKRASSVPTP